MTVVEAKLVEGPFHRRCSMLKNPNCSKFEAQGTGLCLKPFSCNSEVSICVKILKKDDKTTINKQRNKNCNGCECFATIMFLSKVEIMKKSMHLPTELNFNLMFN